MDLTDENVNVSGRWIGYYNNDKDNTFVFNLDQDRKEELIEGTDVNGSTVHIKLKQTSDLDRRHIIICVIHNVKPGTDEKDGKGGCTDFRGVISAERSRIVGMSEKHGATVGIFIMEKRPKLTMDHINTNLKGSWAGCVDSKNERKIALDFDVAQQQPNGVIGTGNVFGNPISIILRIIDFFKHEIIVCAVSNVDESKCKDDCTDFKMTMVSKNHIHGEYKSQTENGTFRLIKMEK